MKHCFRFLQQKQREINLPAIKTMFLFILVICGIIFPILIFLIVNVESISLFGIRYAHCSIAFYCLLIYLCILLIFHGKKQWKEYFLLTSLVAIAFISMELTLRIMLPPRFWMELSKGVSSKKYHHLSPPNMKMFSNYYEKGIVTIETNEDGLRSKYSRKEFLTYKDRLIALGDSFTFGALVKQEKTFPELIEKSLRNDLKRDNIAVLNAGVVSYSPYLENLLFSGKLKYYNPTLVLLFLDVSDIGDDIKYAREAKIDSSGQIYFDLPDEYQRYYDSLHDLIHLHYYYTKRIIKYPYDLISRLVPVMIPKKKSHTYNYYDFSLKIGQVLETNRFFIYRHPLEETRPYFLNTLKNINNIAQQVNQGGGSFILIIVPRFNHWNPAECKQCWELKEYSLKEPYQYEYFRFFDEIKTQLNYNVFNLLPEFQKTHEYPLVLGFDPHFTVKGHAFMARIVTNYLIKNEIMK